MRLKGAGKSAASWVGEERTAAISQTTVDAHVAVAAARAHRYDDDNDNNNNNNNNNNGEGRATTPGVRQTIYSCMHMQTGFPSK